jgi:hypothetical protein
MTTPAMTLESPRRAPSIAFPLVLISLGIVFLLANAGYMTGVSWRHVVQLWPVLLVLLGVDLLLRPRSMLAAVIAEVAIIGAALVYLVAAPALPFGNAVTSGAFTSQESVAREGAGALSLTLGYGAGDLTLMGGSGDLVTVKSTREDIELQRVNRGAGSAAVEVRSVVPDVPFDGSSRAWNVTVPSDIPVGMTLNLGAGDFDIDLSGVKLTHATINNGASDLQMILPKPSGNVPITISTGASSVDLRIPDGTQYSVRVTGAVNSVSGLQESSAYASAVDRLTITISSGASSIAIH